VATQSESEEIEHELRLVGVAAERRALLELRRQHRIDETTFHKLLRELDLAELRWRI